MVNLRRYLILSAQGTPSDTYTCPEDFVLVQAAKYLNCKPWELIEQSLWWTQRALLFMSAEAGAQKALNNNGNR